MTQEHFTLITAALPKIILIAAVFMIAFFAVESLLIRDRLESRMKALLMERDRVRQRERSALPNGKSKNTFHEILAVLANRARLALWLLDAETQTKLIRAGFRDGNARSLFLVARLSLLIGFSVCYAFYWFLMGDYIYLLGTPLAAWVGIRLSSSILDRIAQRRDAELFSASPDIVDLLTICVEAGMAIEVALQRVAEEIGRQSEVAEDEFNLTAAELSYVQKRSDAYANLATRTGAKPIQDLCVALIQADTYGTSVAATLRLQSAQARRLRQLEGERRALSIPPKLSMVMVFFFMPVIFIVMLYPMISKMSGISVSF